VGLEIVSVSQVVADDSPFKETYTLDTHRAVVGKIDLSSIPLSKGGGEIPSACTDRNIARATSAIWGSADTSHHVPDANDPFRT
jgi:hypothetical protein